MISFEDRMALVRAGYTATQIAEFDKQPEKPQPEQPQPEQPEKPQPEKPQTEQQQPEQPEKPQPEKPQTDQQPDFATMMQSINNSMASMLAAMQAQNIKNADMGTPVKESPSDILAKLLNP